MAHPDSPSPHDQHVVQTVYAPRAGSLTVVFLGPYQGLLTHWQKGEPIACPGEADCAPAVHRIRPTWKGYAPVRWHAPAGDWWTPAVLEITECLEELLRGRRLAGELWEISRAAGRRKTRPVQGRYLETRPIDGVFCPFDILPVLQRRYHTTQILLGVPNPVVPRVILPVVTAPGPAAAAEPAAAARAAPTPEQHEALRRLAGRGGAPPPSCNGRE